MGVYVSDIALTSSGHSVPPSNTGKIEATRKWADFSKTVETCCAGPITDWGVDA